MKTKKLEQNFLTAVFLIFVLGFILKSFGYLYLDRRMVLFFGVPTLILLVLLLLADNIPKLSGVHVKASFFGDTAEKQSRQMDSFRRDEQTKKKDTKRSWYIVFSLFFFFVLISVAGFLVAIPIFTFLYLKFFSRESWLLSAGLTVGLWLAVYLGFVRLLGIQF